MAYAPHCDSTILHAPGLCKYCDMHPDWQEYRQVAHIAFTGQSPTDHRAPCPSTWFRDPLHRDAWYGNSIVISEEPDSINDLR